MDNYLFFFKLLNLKTNLKKEGTDWMRKSGYIQFESSLESDLRACLFYRKSSI